MLQGSTLSVAKSDDFFLKSKNSASDLVGHQKRFVLSSRTLACE